MVRLWSGNFGLAFASSFFFFFFITSTWRDAIHTAPRLNPSTQAGMNNMEDSNGSFTIFICFFLAIFNSFKVVFTSTGGKIDISAFTIPYTPRLHQGRESGVGKVMFDIYFHMQSEVAGNESSFWAIFEKKDGNVRKFQQYFELYR